MYTTKQCDMTTNPSEDNVYTQLNEPIQCKSPMQIYIIIPSEGVITNSYKYIL